MNLLNQKTNRFHDLKHGNYFVFALELDSGLKLDTTMTSEDKEAYEDYLHLVFEVLHNLKIKSLALRGHLVLGVAYVPRKLLTPTEVTERCLRYAAAGMPLHENYNPLVLSDVAHAIMMFKRHATRIFARKRNMSRQKSIWIRGYASGAVERCVIMRFLEEGGFERLVERLAKTMETPKAEDGKPREAQEVVIEKPEATDERETKDLKRKALGRVFATRHGVGSAKFVKKQARKAGLKHSRNLRAVEISEEPPESIVEKILGSTLVEFLSSVVGNPLDNFTMSEKCEFVARLTFLPLSLIICVGHNLFFRHAADPLFEWLRQREERKGQTQVPE
ncbi:MAG: hypothetical protein GX561_04610 [Lentisphaerae bacterium]|jgi:hypothetical protein|nr:hypothetical protein [Lentisphaerota bacterium]